MVEVKVLIKGYVTADMGSSCSTITLVKDKNIVMIVDPGTLKDPKTLIKKLKKENLTTNDINYVCITHSHMDHYRNIGLFPKAKVLDFWGIWNKDKVKELPKKFTPNIKIIKTPGHSYDSITLLIKTEKGTIAICGDVFWKKDYPKNDPYAQDKKTLEVSRKKILRIANKIIPGHGEMFET